MQRTRIMSRMIAVLAIITTIGIAPRAWAALDASQAAMLKDAANYLKQLQANLKLAQDSANPADQALTASRARLAAARLSSAKTAIPQITARLERLPADDAQVKAFQAEFDATMKDVNALESRITGGAAPAAPAAAGNKLDYRQEQALKDAQFFIRDVKGKSDAIAEVAMQVEKAPDKQAIDYQLVQRAMNTITDARQKAGNANERLASLPADGTGVPEAAADLKTAIASLDASQKVLEPVSKSLTRLVDPSSYPDLDADLKRLGELTQMYGDPTILQSNRPRAVEVLQQASAVKDEAARIATKYAALMNQQTPISKRLLGAGTYFLEKHNAFMAAARQEQEALPAQIDTDLASVNQLTQQAVQEQKPAFFAGGIPQQMEFVKDKLALLSALDPAQGKAYEAKFAGTVQQVKAAESKLVDSIIASNELPPDRYTDADRAQLVQIATDAWKKQVPGAQVLMARIPSQNWKREELWTFVTNTWYKTDRSKLQVQLLVKHDDKLAAVQPINLYKDHLKGDEIHGGSLYGKDEAPIPRNLISLSKVK